jgi:hypothetical protein
LMPPAATRTEADEGFDLTGSAEVERQFAASMEAMEAGSGNEREPQSISTQLLALVEESGAELYTDQTCKPYISLKINGHRQNWPVESSFFKDWLAMRAYKEAGITPNSNSIDNAVKVLCGRAKHEGPQRTVYLRVARHAGKVYLDLGDETWRAVEIDAQGWRVVEQPPVYFRRTSGMKPLPVPVRGGNLKELGDILNIGGEKNLKLVTGWLVGVLRPEGPYPLLVLHGEQGSAKTR